MNNKIIQAIKYYVRSGGEPLLAIKVYKTEDNKYHRFIAVISNKVEFETREFHTRKIRCIISPKIAVTKYLNEYADAWVINGFKSNLDQKFAPNISEFINKVIIFNYGINKQTMNYIPKRYEQDVKLFDWEFRMLHKPE